MVVFKDSRIKSAGMPLDEWNCDETCELSLASSWSSVRFNIVNDFTPEEEAQVREDRLLRRWDDVLRLRLSGTMWHLMCFSCVSHVTSGTAAPRRRTVGVKTLDLRVSLVTYRHSPTIA